MTAAAANDKCSPHAVGRWRTQLERVMLPADADTFYCARYGSRAAATGQPTALSSPVQEDSRAFFSLCWRCIQRHPCEGSFDRDRDRDRQRQSREKTSWFGVLHTKTWAPTQEPSLTALECHSGDNLAARTSQALSSRSPCSLTHDRQVTLDEPLLPPLRQEACI